uniref:STXB5 n=1 Tax=Rhabditophanes sp. KR3021 TaxID=114890 RepID=A0AC35TFT9_9BILA
MDDKYLYCSCWLHGTIKQFDLTDPGNIKLVGSLFIGGILHSGTGVKVIEEGNYMELPDPLVVKDKLAEGGPQMLQLSLDGKRLYVTNSLYSHWDKQLFAGMKEEVQ